MKEFSKLLSLALLIKRIAITWNINSLENLQNAYIYVCVFMRVKMEIKINGNGAGKKPIVFPHPHYIGIDLETEIDKTIAISHSLFRSYSYTHYEIKWSFCEAEKHPRVEVEHRLHFVERNQVCLFFIQDLILINHYGLTHWIELFFFFNEKTMVRAPKNIL